MAKETIDDVALRVTQEHETISKFNDLRVMISLLRSRAKAIRRFNINPVVWFNNYRIVSYMLRVIDLDRKLINLEEKIAIFCSNDSEEVDKIVKKYRDEIMDLNVKVNVWLFKKTPLAKHYSIS